MHLMLLNVRAHQMIAEEERHQQWEFKVTQQPENSLCSTISKLGEKA